MESQKAKAKSQKFGFTLIEAVVVLAIIGILATLGLANYQTSLARARDAKRKADLETIRSALELYRADNKRYGSSNVSRGWCTVLYGCGSNNQWYNDVAGALISGGYLSELPHDPLYKDLPGKDYFFRCTEGSDRCTKYELYALMEVSANANGTYDNSSCACGGRYNYKVTSP